MNPSWPEVNAAILAVLAEWKRSIRPSRSNGSTHPDVFADRLFSLRHAEMAGDGEVRVIAGTVVTPMARDLLKRRGITLRYVSTREGMAARGALRGEWGFAIESQSGQVEALRRILLEGRDWAEVGFDAVEAAEWVAEDEGRGALVVAEEASVAHWRGGQVEGIRAATVSDPDGVSRAVRHLGANLVVVEAAGKSIYLLKQVGERFRQGGAPVLKEWMR